MNKVKITIGDWSEDGHNHYDEFVFETNKTVKEIQDAYKQSCKLTGLIFDCNNNHTGIEELDWQHPEWNDRKVCVEYENNHISKLAEKILTSYNVEVKKRYNADDFINLMINFIKLSLPDLQIEETTFKKSELDKIPAINGWWNKDCNESWGYGVYRD